MARFVLPAALSVTTLTVTTFAVTTLAIAGQLCLATPAYSQHRPHHPGLMMGAPAAALPIRSAHRPVARPMPPVPREPSVGRPLLGTFAGGFDPVFGRFGEVVVLRPAVQRIELDVTINAAPAVAGIRAAPVGEPVIYRIGGEGARAQRSGRHRLHHSRHHPRADAAAGGVRIVRVAP
jgi:hypothetical protein